MRARVLNLYLEAGLSVAEFCTCARRQHDACITNMNACIWRQRNRYCHRQILVHKHRDSRTSCSKAHAKKLHTDIRTHAKVHIHTHTLTHSHTHTLIHGPNRQAWVNKMRSMKWTAASAPSTKCTGQIPRSVRWGSRGHECKGAGGRVSQLWRWSGSDGHRA